MQFHQLAPVIFIQPALVFLRLRIAHWTRRRRPAESSAAPLLARCALGRLPLRRPRIGAQKIVKVKKHRRTLGCGRHQILEFSEGMRLDDVAFIRSDVVAVLAFAREHVEVVKPEIIHHLLKLPLAVNSTRYLGHAQFGHHALWPLAVVGNRAWNIVGVGATQNVALAHTFRRRIPFGLLLLHERGRIAHFLLCVRGVLLNRLSVASAGDWSLRSLHIPSNLFRGCIASALFLLRLCLRALLGLLLRWFGLRIFINQFRRGHPQRRIVRKARIQRAVIDGIWIELLLDPFGQPHLADALNLAWTRAVGQAVQRVQNRFVGAEFCNRQAFERRIVLGFLVLRRRRIRRAGRQFDTERQNASERENDGEE